MERNHGAFSYPVWRGAAQPVSRYEDVEWERRCPRCRGEQDWRYGSVGCPDRPRPGGTPAHQRQASAVRRVSPFWPANRTWVSVQRRGAGLAQGASGPALRAYVRMRSPAEDCGKTIGIRPAIPVSWLPWPTGPEEPATVYSEASMGEVQALDSQAELSTSWAGNFRQDWPGVRQPSRAIEPRSARCRRHGASGHVRFTTVQGIRHFALLATAVTSILKGETIANTASVLPSSWLARLSRRQAQQQFLKDSGNRRMVWHRVGTVSFPSRHRVRW